MFFVLVYRESILLKESEKTLFMKREVTLCFAYGFDRDRN